MRCQTKQNKKWRAVKKLDMNGQPSTLAPPTPALSRAGHTKSGAVEYTDIKVEIAGAESWVAPSPEPTVTTSGGRAALIWATV